MRLRDIIKRITGISTHIFGVAWIPPEAERDIARRLLTTLEYQRILYVDYKFLLQHYVQAALYNLRDVLTSELKNIDHSMPIATSIRAMRSACRKCLDQIDMYSRLRVFYTDHKPENWQFPLGSVGSETGGKGIKIIDYTDAHHTHRADEDSRIYQNLATWAAVGELRATFGIMIGQLCVNYGLEIENDIASILPAGPEDYDQENKHSV